MLRRYLENLDLSEFREVAVWIASLDEFCRVKATVQKFLGFSIHSVDRLPGVQFFIEHLP